MDRRLRIGDEPAAGTTIYRAARVLAMTADEPEAFAVRNGRVTATGRLDDLSARWPAAEQVDLGDAVVVPGFNDAHAHLAITAEDMLHLDLSPDAVRSLADLRTLVQAWAARTPPESWVRGSRYDDAKMAEGRALTRFDLDEAAPHHPVLVTHVAGHWGVVNSMALDLAGIDERSEAPAGGALGRDASGRLNGVLYEQALFDLAMPQLSRAGRTPLPAAGLEERLQGLLRAQRRFHAAGLTSIGDALVGPDDARLLVAAARRGLLSLRVTMLLAADHADAIRRQEPLDGLSEERLRVGGVKTFVDGAVGGRTCLLEEPFEGRTDDYGIQSRSTAELRDVVRRAQEEGTRVCVHANGDRAIRIILDLLEEAQAEWPRPGLRHRIEHCTVVTEEILRRLHRLQAIAVPFGSYVHYHGSRLLDWYGERRLGRMFAHRWLLDAGVAVAGSSDFPCGPCEPLLGLQSCVTRQGWDGPLLGAQQRVTAREALELYTVRASDAAGDGAVKGRLAAGQLADFVVLGGDPLRVEPTALGSLPVLATYVGGLRVWPD
ncbi:MAG TPA: amidohydrolase [Candidatus Dormibacteraeota bacterium]|nr:amidohydrolase [Candidatus Dormibacteraeota bacterium]